MKLSKYVVCPHCKKPLKGLRCSNCKRSYKIKDKIPVFFSEPSEFKQKEAEFHDNVAKDAKDVQHLDSLRVKNMHEAFLNRIKEAMPKAKILELGCGSGDDLEKLQEMDYKLIGTDISTGMCKETKKKTGAEVYVADAENLPFESNFFDVIFMVATLHHLQKPVKALKEMKRCLKKSGLIIIASEPNSWPYTFHSLKHSKLGRSFLELFRKDYTLYKGPPGDWETKGFNISSIKKISSDAGLKIIDFERHWYTNGFLQVAGFRFQPKIEKLFCVLDKILSKTPLVKRFNWHWNVYLIK